MFVLSQYILVDLVQAILDINTGTWTRILPSGDPDASGNVHFPGPRAGASVLSYQSGLVGSSRNSSADTLVS